MTERIAKDQPNASFIGGLEGKLMLISGDMDENVHIGHTLGVVDALIKKNKDFDLMIVPNAGHYLLFDGYVIRRIWDYFVRHLAGVEPPKNYALNFTPKHFGRAFAIVAASLG